MSETASCRERLARYCVGSGIDIGFGGDAIVPWALCLDRQASPPPRGGNNRTHIAADAAYLSRIFQPASFDWLYSSHVLEDFINPREVLLDWWSLLKPGGYLVLFLPDQQVYLAHCAKHNTVPNSAHKLSNFGLPFVKSVLPVPHVIVHELWPVPNNRYSFDLVVQKPI